MTAQIDLKSVTLHRPGPPTRAQATQADDKLLTVEQVAERLQCCYRTVLRMGKAGEVALIRFGRKFLRVRQSAVDALVAKREGEAEERRKAAAERARRDGLARGEAEPDDEDGEDAELAARIAAASARKRLTLTLD